ncbi:MAG: DUF3848 domain-containing protein [Eubacteriales bacterium]|nr:DUF3848 domain-containing protein [Eubacteriales bacterium]
MTEKEELNTELDEKMFAEQERYRDEPLGMPSAEILDHAYAYTMREDILLLLEYNDMSVNHCKAMLKSQHPLRDVFYKCEDSESPHMKAIQNMTECAANEKLRAEFKRSLHEER